MSQKFISIAYGQNKIDTVYINDESFETPISYKAKDSIHIDAKKRQIHLFTEAEVNLDGNILKAGYILIDLKKEEVTASYRYDKDSNKVERPEMISGEEKITALRLRVNTRTEKVYIEEAVIEQTEAFIYMETGKRHENEEVHFEKGRFTTCELEDPHFHFQMSRAILIPEKKIVTGPMNLWIRGIPTPFGLPFSMIPQQKTKKHGFLFPEITPMGPYGFGVRDLGYFIPINDNWQTSIYATVFNRGSWGLKNETQYLKNYKFNGNLQASYQFLYDGFPDKTSQKNLTLIWSHQTNQKANPFWRFSSNVNFASNNNPKSNLDQQSNTNYFNNQYNSDINLNRIFPGKPYSMGAKISFRQNTQTKQMTLNSPSYNFNLNRILPFKNLIKDGSKEWKQVISRIGVVYRMDFENRSSFRDSLLMQGQWNAIQNSFINGVLQTASLQTAAGLFKNKVKFNPSIDYKSAINFQQINTGFVPLNATEDTLITSTVQKQAYSSNLSFNANLSTTVYSYYRFVGKRKPLLRHILTPTIGYSAVPKMDNYASYIDTTGVIRHYSPVSKSAYTIFTPEQSGFIRFSVNNTFELKTISDKDSSGFKKFKLVEQLTLSGNYNIFKDSLKLSDITISFRSSPLPSLNFVASTDISPYFWDSTGNVIDQYAFEVNRTPGRIKNFQLTTTYTLTSKESKEKLSKTKLPYDPNNWNADYNYFMLHPEQLIDFSIPWKLNLSHIISSSLKSKTIRSYEVKNTLQLNGDISFTKRWKVSNTTYLDINSLKVVNSRFDLTRDMHCWGLSFMWVPVGQNRSFQFRIFATGSMLNELQQTFTKPPLFF